MPKLTEKFSLLLATATVGLIFLGGKAVAESKSEEAGAGTAIALEKSLKCADERTCKAACGVKADDTECNAEIGICTCLNEHGPSRRCRNVRHEEESCTKACQRKVAQICHTDFGRTCTCFLRNTF